MSRNETHAQLRYLCVSSIYALVERTKTHMYGTRPNSTHTPSVEISFIFTMKLKCAFRVVLVRCTVAIEVFSTQQPVSH